MSKAISEIHAVESVTEKTIFGAPEGHDARILIEKARELMRDDRVLVHVALDDRRTNFLEECISYFGNDVEIAVFPAWDCLPYDRVSPSADIVSQRVATLCKLMSWTKGKTRKPRILLTTVNAVLQKVMPKQALENAAFSFEKGGRLKEADLFNYLTANGYQRSDTVREPGEFAVRGGIIDVFPADSDSTYKARFIWR